MSNNDHQYVIETVSPFDPEDYPRVWYWQQSVPGSIADQSPQDIDSFVDFCLERHERALTWGVYRDGLLGGFVCYEPMGDQTGNAHCIFKKGKGGGESFFGRATTLPALNQVAADIFAIGVERIGMTPFQTNKAIIALIRDLGGVVEALVYPRDVEGNAITIKGEHVPMIQYGLYRSTFGQPDAQGWTYEQWINTLVERELKRRQYDEKRKEERCHKHLSLSSPQSSVEPEPSLAQ